MEVGISFESLTAGQTFTLTIVDLTTCKLFTTYAVSMFSASMVNASFDPYNPGTTPIDLVLTTISGSSNKLTFSALVPNGTPLLNLNIAVDFIGATSAEIESILDVGSILLA
ncbi:hypothetical protein C8R44DRAFT_868779 [Mycena epipterygia]|nr:hypothetical protein C8R44DRAFT_868779 [Mycena epipterygia]